MRNILALKFVCVLTLGIAQGVATATEAPKRPYVVLDKNLSQLRADFNANAGKVRMLYIVGPTCGVCLRGLSDLQHALYAKQGNDPRLVTFVVHVPTLGAREANVPEAAELISSRNAIHYWEETGIIGRLMQRAIGHTDYTWDFWGIYDPDVVWSDDHQIPVPTFWQHQLNGLPREKKLDADVFAAKVRGFLAQVSAPSTGTPAASAPNARFGH